MCASVQREYRCCGSVCCVRVCARGRGWVLHSVLSTVQVIRVSVSVSVLLALVAWGCVSLVSLVCGHAIVLCARLCCVCAAASVRVVVCARACTPACVAH